jgi:MazG family protein
MKKKREAFTEFGKLLVIVEKLGSRGGCPWDRKQTLKSMRAHLVEETCEVLEALDRRDMERLKAELGDLLYIILFIARIADDRDAFRLHEVFQSVARKLVSRHPAIFARKKGVSAGEASRLWHESKRLEKKGRRRVSILDDIPPALPALQKAHKVQIRAARIGFDWPSLSELLPKLEEEALEFLNDVGKRRRKKAGQELGDLFFTLVNISRFLELDPESVMTAATSKFERRFKKMEQRLAELGVQPAQASLAEMDRIWNEIKKTESKAHKTVHCPDSRPS